MTISHNHQINRPERKTGKERERGVYHVFILLHFMPIQLIWIELRGSERERERIGQWAGASHSWQGIMCRVMDNGLGAHYILPSTGRVCVCVCLGAVMVWNWKTALGKPEKLQQEYWILKEYYTTISWHKVTAVKHLLNTWKWPVTSVECCLPAASEGGPQPLEQMAASWITKTCVLFISDYTMATFWVN